MAGDASAAVDTGINYNMGNSTFDLKDNDLLKDNETNVPVTGTYTYPDGSTQRFVSGVPVSEILEKKGIAAIDAVDLPVNTATSTTTLPPVDAENYLSRSGLGNTLESDRDPGAVNAAEAALLQRALSEAYNSDGTLKDPNFIERVLGGVLRNLSLGMVDINDPVKRAKAKAILDAYEKTGKFVYDTEENAIDLSKPYNTAEGKAAFDKLLGLSSGSGQEPTVIGTRDAAGDVIGFGEGTGFQNVMGDFNPVFDPLTGQVVSGGSETFDASVPGIFQTDIFPVESDPDRFKNDGDDEVAEGVVEEEVAGEVDTGYTIVDGKYICNTPGYVHDPKIDACVLASDLVDDKTKPVVLQSFDDVLKRVVRPSPGVAPISDNIRTMQDGGMVNTNKMVDEFLVALGA
jgi:hypothetical protein